MLKERKAAFGVVEESLIWNYFIQICIALEAIHKKQILHRVGGNFPRHQ
jgi:hypothetical protein